MMTFENFMEKNNDWILGREEVGRRAYENYCDTTARYKEMKSNLQELIQELQAALENKIHVSYVMGISPKHNFGFVGNDLDLTTMKYIEATDTLDIYTTSGGDLQIPSTMRFKKIEGITPFTNEFEYHVAMGNFSIGFLFHYE